MRLFAALSPPGDLRDRLVAAQAGLPAGKLVSWENLHLTLAFFGDVDGRRAEDLHAALSRIRVAAFDLDLDGAGAFGSGQTRSLHIAAKRCPALAQLNEKVERAAEEAQVKVESGRFTPHVTLARLRPGRAHPARVATWLSGVGAFRAGPYRTTSFQLYESHLGRSGAIYREIARYALEDRS